MKATNHHTKRAVVLSLALLAILGCEKDEARKAVEKAASKVSQEYEESKVLAHAAQFIRAAESRDLENLERLCADSESADYQAIMSCYYNAFAIEDGQGVDAARRYLAEEMARDDDSPAKRKGVEVLNEYFEAKGSLCTREAAGLILTFALEVKYPHGGAVLGSLIAEKLGLIALPRSTSPPATSPSPAPAEGG